MPFLTAYLPRLFTFAIFMLSASLLEGAPLNPAQIPSDTKWILHFDVESAHQWSLAQKWQSEMKDKEWCKKKLGEVVEQFGWNPTEDLQGVTIYDNEYGRHNGVLALHVQNLDRDKLAASFKKSHPDAKTEEYRKRFISSWTESSPYRGEHPVSGSLVDNSLMIVSSSSQKIKAAIDVLDGEASALNTNSSLLKSFNREAILACRAIDVPADYQQKTRCPVLERCQTATMFFTVKDDVMYLQYDLEANDEELAAKMKGAVVGMRAIMDLQVDKDELAQKMLDALKITREGNHLLIRWQGESDQFAKVAQEMKKHKKWGRYDWKKNKTDSAPAPKN